MSAHPVEDSGPPVRAASFASAGESFALVNDHDPGQFSRDYMESRPEVWKVRIGRTATA